MNIPTTPVLTLLAQPQRLVGPPPSGSAPAAPRESFSWSKALALPAYAYGGGAATLSGLCAFAQRFPYGGVTINPNGVVLNPEWTRHFSPDSMAGALQPIAAGVGAAVFLVRGGLELSESLKTGDARTQVAAALDLSLAATSALQLVNPGIGAAASVALLVARGAVEAHP